MVRDFAQQGKQSIKEESAKVLCKGSDFILLFETECGDIKPMVILKTVDKLAFACASKDTIKKVKR